MKIVAGIIIIAIVISAALFLFRVPATSGLPPFLPPPATPEETPGITEIVPGATLSPVLTTQLPETTAAVTTVQETTVPSSLPTEAVICASDRHLCGTDCADLMNDPANCGGCGSACNAAMACRMGTCLVACAPDQTACFDGCHNLSIDSANCGVCGNTCPVGLACNRSVCSPTVTTVIPTYGG